MSLPHKYYEVGTLAVDGWAVTYGTARRALGGAAAMPLLTVPNVTAHTSTASVLITVLLYNGPLFCGFNIGIKALRARYALIADVGLSVVRPLSVP